MTPFRTVLLSGLLCMAAAPLAAQERPAQNAPVGASDFEWVLMHWTDVDRLNAASSALTSFRVASRDACLVIAQSLVVSTGVKYSHSFCIDSRTGEVHVVGEP